MHIKGGTAHGAYPHLGIDAMMIAAHFLVAVQTMMAREKDTFSHAIITFGQIKGGTARNIICDEVEINGICRTFNPETREMLNRRIDEILKGITMIFGGTYEFERQRSHPALICDPDMAEHVRETADMILGSGHVIDLPHGSLGCESFAYFAEARKGAFFWMGTGNKEAGIDKPLHSSSFDIDERALPLASAMHAALAWNYLEKHSQS